MRRRVGIIAVIMVSILLATPFLILAQESETGSEGTEEAAAETEKIDLNTATLEKLKTLPGVGPKLAQAIIDGRPYEKIEDVMDVKGIAEKRFEKIKELIMVTPVDDKEADGEDTSEESEENS